MRRKVTVAAVSAAIGMALAAFAFVWHVPRSARAFLPFGPERSCVIAVTDDTDFFQFETTAPVYALIDSLGLRVTKTVWTYDHEDHKPTKVGLSLEDPDYMDWILGEAEAGHEIILHSASAGDDVRERTIEAHQRLAELVGRPARMIIFHSKNLEAFYWGEDRIPNPLLRYLYGLRIKRPEFRGGDPDSPFYWVDVSRKLVRYVRGYATRDVNTLALNPSMPYLDPWTPMAPLWCACSNGSVGEEFVTLLDAANVERLKRQMGVSIVYTHLARGFVAAGPDGELRVAPEVRETLLRCGTDPTIEFAPAGEVLDRLRVAQYLEDSVMEGVRAGEEVVLLIPRELAPAMHEISVVPSRLPASLNAPSVEPGTSVRLTTWLDAVGWEVRPGDVGIFAGARPLSLRERWRLVLRWLWSSSVTPQYEYESGAAP